jgi:hypothetical protein
MSEIGPMADDVKATAADAGREALDRGKDVVQEARSAAIETAKERGREEGRAVRKPSGEGSGSGPGQGGDNLAVIAYQQHATEGEVMSNTQMSNPPRPVLA